MGGNESWLFFFFFSSFTLGTRELLVYFILGVFLDGNSGG